MTDSKAKAETQVDPQKAVEADNKPAAQPKATPKAEVVKPAPAVEADTGKGPTLLDQLPGEALAKGQDDPDAKVPDVAESKDTHDVNPTPEPAVEVNPRDESAQKVGDLSLDPDAPETQVTEAPVEPDNAKAPGVEETTGTETEESPIESAPGGVNQLSVTDQIGAAYSAATADAEAGGEDDASNVDKDAELIKSVEHHHAERVTGDPNVLDAPETDELDAEPASEDESEKPEKALNAKTRRLSKNRDRVKAEAEAETDDDAPSA